MKVLVAYDSKFGNTERIATRLTELLEDLNVATKCIRVDKLEAAHLRECEFLAIGGPTHSFGMSKPMSELLGRLDPTLVKGKGIFVFETRFDSIISGSSAKRIEKRLLKMGATIVRPRYTAFVTSKGYLLEEGMDQELKNAARTIMEYRPRSI